MEVVITPNLGEVEPPGCSDAAPLSFNPRLEALLQWLDRRVALAGPDPLLVQLAAELHRQRRDFLRLSGLDPYALAEAGALQRDRM